MGFASRTAGCRGRRGPVATGPPHQDEAFRFKLSGARRATVTVAVPAPVVTVMGAAGGGGAGAGALTVGAGESAALAFFSKTCRPGFASAKPFSARGPIVP